MQAHPPGKETERDSQCARGIWAKMTELGCKISKTGTDVETVNGDKLFIWEGGTKVVQDTAKHALGAALLSIAAQHSLWQESQWSSVPDQPPGQEVSPEHPTRRGRMEGNGLRPS